MGLSSLPLLDKLHIHSDNVSAKLKNEQALNLLGFDSSAYHQANHDSSYITFLKTIHSRGEHISIVVTQTKEEINSSRSTAVPLFSVSRSRNKTLSRVIWPQVVLGSTMKCHNTCINILLPRQEISFNKASLSTMTYQQLVLISNICHADLISHSNAQINKTSQPASFIPPYTHGSHQYRKDMSTCGDLIATVHYGGTFMVMSMTICLWQLVIDASPMATCSGGSEHCTHRSFAQPSESEVCQ